MLLNICAVINLQHIYFPSISAVRNFLIHYQTLNGEEAASICRFTSGQGLEARQIENNSIEQEKSEQQELERGPVIYNNFLAVKLLDISGFTINKELLALLLELLPNLQKISLQTEDIAPLKNLGNLKELSLRYSDFKDLSSIPLTVEKLSLCVCEKIEDFSPLARLSKLKDLNLGKTKIKDLSCISLTVEKLHLWGCMDIEDFSPLRELPNLKELDLSYTKIKDLSCLPATVETLHLRHCNSIKYCPEWLKEKIRNNSLKVYNGPNLLDLPTSPPHAEVSPEPQQAAGPTTALNNIRAEQPGATSGKLSEITLK